jgi:hypothetical protein
VVARLKSESEKRAAKLKKRLTTVKRATGPVNVGDSKKFAACDKL